METYISKDQFKWIGENLIKFIIDKDFHSRIDLDNLTLRIYREKSILNYDDILEKYSINESSTAISFIKHVILSDYSLKSFKTIANFNNLK